MPESKVIKETVERIKKELPGVLEQSPVFSLIAIAAKLGVTRQTLLVVRKKSKKIASMIDKYQQEKKPSIEDLVKNTWFNRLATGKAHASEYIFFMMNHFPSEYQDKRAIVNNTNILNVPDKAYEAETKFLKTMAEKDLNDLVARLVERKQAQAGQSRI